MIITTRASSRACHARCGVVVSLKILNDSPRFVPMGYRDVGQRPKLIYYQRRCSSEKMLPVKNGGKGNNIFSPIAIGGVPIKAGINGNKRNYFFAIIFFKIILLANLADD